MGRYTLFCCLALIVAACAPQSEPGGNIKDAKVQYGSVRRVSVDSTYGVVCYVTSDADTTVYLTSDKPLSCVYSPKINPTTP